MSVTCREQTEKMFCWCTMNFFIVCIGQLLNKYVPVSFKVGKIMATARQNCFVVPFSPRIGLSEISGCRRLLCAEMHTQHCEELAYERCFTVF